MVARRLDEADPASDRFIDLQLDLVDEVTGEVLLRVGGRWDRRRREYLERDAQRSRVLRFHRGQVEKVRWWRRWFEDHLRFLDGQVRLEAAVYSALWAGGRRGGKTFAGVASCVAYAVGVPESIVWIVCPTEGDFEEVTDYLHNFMPASWYQELGEPFWTFTLANGSKIVLRSGHNPGALKKGRCDYAFINEGQRQKHGVLVALRGGIADRGGLVLVAANPPDDGDQGDWVGDMASEAQEKLRDAVYSFFDPLENPHIDFQALASLAKEVDKHTFDVQVRGMFLPPKNAVFYNWSQTHNERLVPELARDITRPFTMAFHEDALVDYHVVVDIQRFPFICATIGKVFANPDAPHDHQRALFWKIDEVTVEGGDEYLLDAALTAGVPELAIAGKGLDRIRAGMILDSSGFWQGSDWESRMKNKEQLKGRPSAEIFKKLGWKHVWKVDRKADANPDVIERCRATCARIQTESGERYLFVDPRCKQTLAAMRTWKMAKNRKPSRESTHSHLGDCVSYWIWHFYPRRIRDLSIGFKVLSKRPGRETTEGY